MKWIGIILVLTSTTGVGIYLSSNLKNRVKQLERLQLMIDIICSQISYLKLPVTQIMQNLQTDQRFKSFPIFRKTLEYLPKSLSFSEAFKTAVFENKKTLHLTAEDIDVLLNIGTTLGTTDVQGQLAALKLQKNMSETRLSDAMQDSTKYGKLYRSLGFLSGAFITIFLI